MNGPWLVMCDVDGVQTWLLRSVHLREIAGASQLLVDHDDEMPKVAVGGQALFSGGGSALVRFDHRAQAERLQRELPSSLQRRTVDATVTVSEPQGVGTGPFGDAVARAVRDVEQKKRLGRLHGETADACFALRCQGCASEPVVAEGQVRINNEPRLLGAGCLARHKARSRAGWLDWMRIRPGWQGIGPAHLPADATELSGGGKLALVLADVNGVGERLASLQTEESYKVFSEGLTRAVHKALVEAVADVVTPREDDGWKLAVEVLYAGGDDVLLACRDDLALRLVRKLVTEFGSRASGDSNHWCGGVPLGISAAVAVVGPKFPFRAAHAIAGRLLRHAKRVARQERWTEGAVDWAVVTEAWAEGGPILSDRSIESSSLALELTGRPYRASAAGLRSLGSFQEACSKLATEFPRNKLFDLRGLCSASQLAPRASGAATRRAVDEARQDLSARVLDLVGRLQRNPDAARRWTEAISALGLDPQKPFWNVEAEWRTPVGDLAEGIGLWGLS